MDRVCLQCGVSFCEKPYGKNMFCSHRCSLGYAKKPVVIGEKNNNITIICEIAPKEDVDAMGYRRLRRMIKCRCDCGKVFDTYLSHFKSGKAKSCGCIKGKAGSTHGLSSHPLYKIWLSIKARCYNKNSKAYKNYGGRGVVVCDEWLNDFMLFYGWAMDNGWEQGLEIDKDIKGGLVYSPNNCTIVSSKENSFNRRCSVKIIVNDVVMTAEDAANIAKVKPATIYQRISKGWVGSEILKKNRCKAAL